MLNRNIAPQFETFSSKPFFSIEISSPVIAALRDSIFPKSVVAFSEHQLILLPDNLDNPNFLPLSYCLKSAKDTIPRFPPYNSFKHCLNESFPFEPYPCMIKAFKVRPLRVLILSMSIEEPISLKNKSA